MISRSSPRLAELIRHTARTYLALSQLEQAITAAHQAHFVSNQETYAGFEHAAALIERNLAEREQVYRKLVATWEKTRLPKGYQTADKKFFHQQDRARHYAFRTADMRYLVMDEDDLRLEEYLKDLKQYMAYYRQTYLDKQQSSLNKQ